MFMFHIQNDAIELLTFIIAHRDQNLFATRQLHARRTDGLKVHLDDPERAEQALCRLHDGDGANCPILRD